MNLEVMEGEKKSKQVHTAEAGKNDQESGSSSCPEEQNTKFPIRHIFVYWILFGQFLLLFLILFGYDSLWPAIDWISSIIPSVEALRHSTKVMNADLARAHYALMWLFSPVLIIATILSPVRPGERREFIEFQSRSKDICFAFIPLLMGIFFIFFFPDGSSALSLFAGVLGRFAIGFALLSSVFTSFIALTFLWIKIILTD